MTARLAALAAALLLWPSCAEDEPASEPAAVAPTTGWFTPFTVRGRWDEPVALSWRCDPAEGKVPADVFEETVARALASWGDSGAVSFRKAGADETPDVVFSWARAAHGTCKPFGQDFSVAHTGPVERGTFVHFDAGHEWSAEGETGESLLAVAAHEAGHVLGLDHSPDPRALMYADATVSEPQPQDLAGLHSLYGGGENGPGDLFIYDWSEAALEALALEGGMLEGVTLRRISPADRTDYAVFDTDGDGDDELLVWRTDREGVGALVIYHFGPGARPARTVGPLLGVVPLGAKPWFRVGDAWGRWLVAESPDGTRRVRRFDDHGRLARPTPAEMESAPRFGGAGAASLSPLEREMNASAMAVGDLDGDGRVNAVARPVRR